VSRYVSWRLCESILFESIDDAGDAVFDERDLKVDEQAKALVREPKISQKLLFVNRRDNLDRFDFNDHLSSTIRSARNPVSMRTFS
jgi:hypothetical protein